VPAYKERPDVGVNALEYSCVCGEKIIITPSHDGAGNYEKITRLVRCWNCLEEYPHEHYPDIPVKKN
jgi:hypothetical protein